MTDPGPAALAGPVLDRLMPLHLRLSPAGRIIGHGPTLAKLLPDRPIMGAGFFDIFTLRRPAGITSIADLARRAGEQVYLGFTGQPWAALRGLAVPMARGKGLLVNLSFGIGVVEAVRRHDLTVADFAPTDLAVELLYLVEAKTAVMDELGNLNQRLQGARLAAEEQALTDTLTGLRNRRAQDMALQGLARDGGGFGLMHIDLDYFKAVNDTLGHAAGDHVLRAVAMVLTEETRAGDTVARVGGDEFVILFPGQTDAPVLGRIARRIIDRLSTPIAFEGQTCRISASIGMTLSTFYDAPDPDRMLSDADDALYASKRAGRGRAQLFEVPVTARAG